MLGEPMSIIEQKLDDAARLLADVKPDEEQPGQLGSSYNEATLTLRNASCYIEAGKPRQAAVTAAGCARSGHRRPAGQPSPGAASIAAPRTICQRRNVRLRVVAAEFVPAAGGLVGWPEPPPVVTVGTGWTISRHGGRMSRARWSPRPWPRVCIRLSSVWDEAPTVTAVHRAGSAPGHEMDGTDFGVRLSTDTTRAVALLTGDLDRSSAPRLQQTLTQLYRDGYQHVALDLAGLTLLDFTGVDVLARTAEQFRAAGRQLTLTHPTDAARRALATTSTTTTHWHAALRADELLSTHLSYPCPETMVCMAGGEVDILTAPLLAAAIWDATSRCTQTVVVDLTAVTFFSAKGVEVLEQAANASHGQRVVAVAPDGGPAARVIDLADVAKLIPRYATLCEALAAVPH